MMVIIPSAIPKFPARAVPGEERVDPSRPWACPGEGDRLKVRRNEYHCDLRGRGCRLLRGTRVAVLGGMGVEERF